MVIDQTPRSWRRVTVPAPGGGALVGLERGAGPPLVWAHGLLSSKEASIAALRSVRGLRVVAFDQRGHGESPRPGSLAEASIQVFARDLLATLDGLGLESALLGGESMGAAAVLRFTTDHPDRVSGLVLDRPAFGPEGSGAFAWREQSRLLATIGIDRWMGRALAELPEPARSSATARYRPHWQRHDSRSIALLLEALDGWRIPAGRPIESIDVPAVVRAWPGDPVHPTSLAEWTAEALPRAQLILVSRELYHDETRDAESLASCIEIVRRSLS